MKNGCPSPQVSPPSKAIKLPREWPHVVRSGDVAIKIYKNNGHIRGKNFRSFVVSYYASGKRHLRRFVDFGKAVKVATGVADQKAQGALGAAALSAANRLALEEALALLAKNEGAANAGLSRLIEIVRDYASARAILPAGTTLSEAAHCLKQRHPTNMPRKTVREAVDDFLADRKSAGCSAVHIHDLETRLGQFAKAFATPINAVSAPVVQQWLYALKNLQTGNPISPRSKENMLRQVVSLFNFARRQKYVPADLALEIAEIPTPKKQHAPIGVYTPADIIAILAAADTEIVPALAISAFAGLRLAEVSRLDWREVRLSERLIVVEADKAKTAARRLVPISANLAAWLTSHRKRSGRVNPCLEELRGNVGHALGLRIERAAARAKVPWKRNGFRHSYISYRVATLKDVPAVALECGNSPQIIFSNYRALATEAEGKAWFGVKPSPKTGIGHIIPMPKQRRGKAKRTNLLAAAAAVA